MIKKSIKNFVLFHKYLETGFVSIVGFSDSYIELWDVMLNHPRYGSNRHQFLITCNFCSDYYNMPLRFMDSDGNMISFYNHTQKFVKDSCLINICKNVAEYLAVGEYALLKYSYFKSSSWFEKAKNSAALGSEIIDNY